MPPNHQNSKSHKRIFDPVPEELDKIGKLIVDSAYTVHKNLGPGLLEKVFEVCFCHELAKRGLKSQRQIDIPIVYDNLIFEDGLRLDVLVENKVICEIKAVETVNSVWTAQILSHLKLTNKRLGYLINFNVENISFGIKRIVYLNLKGYCFN
jgi:GxxExxY protein